MIQFLQQTTVPLLHTSTYGMIWNGRHIAKYQNGLLRPGSINQCQSEQPPSILDSHWSKLPQCCQVWLGNSPANAVARLCHVCNGSLPLVQCSIPYSHPMNSSFDQMLFFYSSCHSTSARRRVESLLLLLYRQALRRSQLSRREKLRGVFSPAFSPFFASSASLALLDRLTCIGAFKCGESLARKGGRRDQLRPNRNCRFM